MYSKYLLWNLVFFQILKIFASLKNFISLVLCDNKSDNNLNCNMFFYLLLTQL